MGVSTHKTYDALFPKWKYAWDVYTGEYIDDGKLKNYLVQRKQGEADPAYDERKKLADPALDFATVADSLNGMQFASEEKTSRTWQPEEVKDGFGDPKKKGSIAYRLKRNVNGEGMKLQTMLKRAGVRFTVQHWVWGLVDTAILDGEGNVIRPPVAHIVDPRDVVNWRKENGRLVEVLVKDKSDNRQSIEDDFDDEDYYVHYELSGWTRKKEKQGRLVATGESGQYAFYEGAEKKQRVLPIFAVMLPLPRMVGHLLAKKCIALFNAESELDNLLRLCCMPRFGVDEGETGFSDFDDVVDSIAEGEAIIQGADHKYIAPPAEPATVRNERLKQKRTDFYEQGFREYGDAAREQTATQRRQDWAAGVAAYLTLQGGGLEEFEWEMMRRFEQAEFPDKPQLWGQYAISRSTQFEPEDVKETLQDLKRDVFGAGGLPIDVETATDIVMKYLDEHGFDGDRDRIQEAVQQHFDQKTQMADAMGGML